MEKIVKLWLSEMGQMRGMKMRSTRFEQQDGHLSHIEIDEVLGLMGDIGSEITSDHTVPSWVVFLIELLLDVGGNVFLDIELFESNVGAINGILLHFFIHVGMLDDGLTFSA